MGVGQLIRNVITTETDPTVANFTKSLTSNNTILTAVNAATGTISASVLPSYVDDVLNFANLAAFPVAGETGKIYVTEDTNKTYRWSGSVYVEISSSATAGEALKLTNARTISTTGDATYSVSFDGSANVSSAITLANSGVTAGTYNNSATQVRPFTVDAKGRITGTGAAVDITPPWSAITGKPTTLDGFGITGGTITGHLSITGSLRGTGAGVWLIETSPLGTVAGNTQLLWTKTGFVSNNASERTWIRRRVDGSDWQTTLFHNGITVDIAFGTPGVDTRAWWERDIQTGSQFWGNANTTFFSVDSSRFHIPLTTPSTSTTTGGLVVSGGVGVGGSIFAGNINVGGIARASSFRVGANQIIGSRITGWVASTGTATRTTFATSTVTLSELAERVKALIDDLTTHGLIGA